MRHRTDDEVYRITLRYHGPVNKHGEGKSFPWPAVRVASYIMFGGVLLAMFFIEAQLSTGSVLVPVDQLILKIALAVGVTWALMRSVSHERPLSAVLRWFVCEADTRASARQPSPRRQRRRLKTEVNG